MDINLYKQAVDGLSLPEARREALRGGALDRPYVAQGVSPAPSRRPWQRAVAAAAVVACLTLAAVLVWRWMPSNTVPGGGLLESRLTDGGKTEFSGIGETGVSGPQGALPLPDGWGGIYAIVFDSYFEHDVALHQDLKYLAIHLDTLEQASREEKQALVSYFSDTRGLPILDASFDSLKADGKVFEGNTLKDGLLLEISRVDIAGSTMVISGMKFKGGLAANFFDSTFVQEDGKWHFTGTVMTAIS